MPNPVSEVLQLARKLEYRMANQSAMMQQLAEQLEYERRRVDGLILGRLSAEYLAELCPAEELPF